MSHPLCYTRRMLIVKIEPIKPLASQRTKNRIRESGPWFTLERRHTDEEFGIGQRAIGFGLQSWLLRSKGWVGWLPISEFRVIDSEAGH